jgi:GntR family transcriptional regulator
VEAEASVTLPQVSSNEPGAGPRHATIAADLRARIRSGALAPGTPIPSEAELAARFAVSRGTVRQALSSLRAEGLISGGQGRRTVVARPTLAQSFDKLVSFTSWAESLGHEPSARTLELVRRPADAQNASDLELAEGTEIFQYRRLRLLDGQPAMLEASSFIEPVGRLLLDCDLNHGSVYTQLGEMGVVFHEAHQRIAAISAAGDEADLLGVRRHAPLLEVRRIVLDPDGRPLEASRDIYRGEEFAITVHNRAAQTSAGVGLSIAGAEAGPKRLARDAGAGQQPVEHRRSLTR